MQLHILIENAWLVVSLCQRREASFHRFCMALTIFQNILQNVPVLQPDHASFPELLAKAGGGGWLYSPNNQDDLVQKLEFAFSSDLLLRQQGLLGHNAVMEYFNSSRMAFETMNFYKQLLTMP